MLNDEVDRMWYNARSLCMSQGGDLASIHNSQEKDFIFETVNCQFKLTFQKLRGVGITFLWYLHSMMFQAQKNGKKLSSSSLSEI